MHFISDSLDRTDVMKGVDLTLVGSLLGLASSVLTSALIIILRPVLARYALARPNARSSHKVPTPQGGGMAIVIVATASILITLAISDDVSGSLVGTLVASTLLAVVGAADDIIVLRASPRLFLQLVAAALVVCLLTSTMRIIPFVPLALERVVLVLALVWFVNLVNFMDGIDWITVAEVLPVSAGIAVLAALGCAPASSFVVAIALGGATVGFAPFNRPVAKLFLGDVGSLPLGLLLGWQLLTIAGSGHLVAAVLLPLYYLADATITLVRRVGRRERVWEAHRTHFYQRATDRGFSVMEIVMRVFGTNIVLLGLAIGSAVVRSAEFQIVLLAAGGTIVALLLRVLSRGRQ